MNECGKGRERRVAGSKKGETHSNKKEEERGGGGGVKSTACHLTGEPNMKGGADTPERGNHPRLQRGLNTAKQHQNRGKKEVRAKGTRRVRPQRRSP